MSTTNTPAQAAKKIAEFISDCLNRVRETPADWYDLIERTIAGRHDYAVNHGCPDETAYETAKFYLDELNNEQIEDLYNDLP